MFLLVKWYFDLVAEDGTAFIAYAARLRWGAVRMRYAATLLSSPAATVQEAATLRHVRPPHRTRRSILWRNDSLDVRGRWQVRSPAIRATLASGEEGGIDWACVAPRADASVHIGSRRLVGRGYVERIRVGIPPWRLPFHVLRWGRFISPEHSLVWIGWEGESPLRRVWLDGVEQADASISDAGVRGLDGRRGLRIDPARVLRQRQVLTTLADVVPELARRLRGPLSGMHELKWLGRGTLGDGHGDADEGWTIHEVVTWRAQP